MQRLLKVVLVGLMAVSLVACGGGKEVKAEVTNKETNEVEKLSAKEIKAIDKENGAKFDKYYQDTKIKFTGTVKEVSPKVYSGMAGPFVVIQFEEGFKVMSKSENLDIAGLTLADISAGDKFEVESTLFSGSIEVECGLNGNTTMKKAN